MPVLTSNRVAKGWQGAEESCTSSPVMANNTYTQYVIESCVLGVGPGPREGAGAEES